MNPIPCETGGEKRTLFWRTLKLKSRTASVTFDSSGASSRRVRQLAGGTLELSFGGRDQHYWWSSARRDSGPTVPSRVPLEGVGSTLGRLFF